MVGRSSPRRHTIGAIGPARSRSMVGPIAALSDSADGPHTVAIEPGSGVVLDGIDPAAGATRPGAVMFEHGAVDVVHDVSRTPRERQGRAAGERDGEGVWRCPRLTVTRCRTPSAAAPAGRGRRDACTKGG